MFRPKVQMPRLIRDLFRDRRANATVVTVFSLLSLIGGAGLATDTIQWTLSKRQLQRMADSAALAGAFAKARGQSNDSTKTIAQSELNRYTALNMITMSQTTCLDGTTSTSCIETPPSTGPYSTGTYASKSVRVTISAGQSLPFSGVIFGLMNSNTTVTQKATATAAAIGFGEYCAFAKKSNSGTGIQLQGNATLDLGCGIVSNAQGSASVNRVGSTTININPIAAVGNISGTYPGATLLPYSIPQSDPFASLPLPSIPQSCQNNTKPNQYSLGPNTSDAPNGNNGTSGFCYTDMNVKGNLTLPDNSTIIINGAYGGGLTVNSGGTITCHLCTFILTTSGTDYSKIPVVDMSGAGKLDLTSPTTGTYAGILFFQDGRATSISSNKINGTSDAVLQGAMYFPAQELQFTGDSGFTAQCLQLVAWDIVFSGNTKITNSCDKYKANGLTGTRIRLVD